MQIKELSSPPSFNECLVIGQIASEAFRDDSISRLLAPHRYCFRDQIGNLAALKSPREKLSQIEFLASAWKHHVYMYAWKWYVELSCTGYRAFIGYNDQELPVGVAVWSEPLPLRPTPSLWQHIWFRLRKWRAALHMHWIQFWYPGLCARALPVSHHFLDKLVDNLEFTHTDARVAQLLAMDPEKRAKVPYTEEFSYYCHLFAVSEQGRGHGSALFRGIELSPRGFTVNGAEFAPQLSLCASPMGVPLYKKFGFTSIRQTSIDCRGELFIRDLMIA